MLVYARKMFPLVQDAVLNIRDCSSTNRVVFHTLGEEVQDSMENLVVGCQA